MEHRLHHNHSLQQTLTPQMQQSLHILQTPTLELQHLIQQEMDANPVLESDPIELSLEANEMAPDSDFDEEFSHLSQLDDDWREMSAQHKNRNGSSLEAEEKHRFVLESLVETQTLQDHLLEQLNTEPLTPLERAAGRLIIGNLNERGFLQIPLEEICFSQGIPLPQLERGKVIVQSFEPAGVGAEDLRESLLIQLQRRGLERHLAFRVVDEQLDNLAAHRYPLISKELGVSVESVSHAAELIASLDPRPGQQFVVNRPTYVTPDLQIKKQSGHFVVQMTEDHLPRLRISNLYKDLMTSEQKAEVRGYIKEKIRSGKFLIRTIAQRQLTIRSIAEEIVKRQIPFMEQGRTKLVPLTMSQVADAVGVHETTVSRTVNGKFMATPHGVFEMKFFFRTGFTTESGGSMSNTSVKDAIADLVRKEEAFRPLSDEVLKKMLETKGIKIARRTIAKYREELGLLPSHLRKSYSA